MDDQKLAFVDNTGSRPKIKKAGKITHNIKLSGILKSREIFCVGRDSNLDGITGVSLLMHTYGLKPSNSLFANYSDFGKLRETIKKRRIKNSVVVFNDLAISPINFSESKQIIKILKSSNNVVIWLDHHPWGNKIADYVSKRVDFVVFGESRDYCASEIVYLLLCKKRDSTTAMMAKLAHYSDFVVRSKYDQLLYELSYSIVQAGYSGNRKRGLLVELSKAISRLDFNNSAIKRLYAAYVRGMKANKRELIANSYKIGSGKYAIGLAFGKRLQTNDACATIRNALNTDMEIYVNIETGKCGIRSKDHVDGSAMAKKLGGDGHPQASGFNVNVKKFSNFRNVIMKKKFAAKVEKLSKSAYR